MSHNLNLEAIENHISAKDFIQKVLDKIYTEEEGKTIKAELQDHIMSLAEEYMMAGHDQDVSIKKALLQMGDPTEIGYSFTDYDGMKRRKYMRIGLKWMALGILAVTLVVTAWLSGGMSSDTVSTSTEESTFFNGWLSVYYIFYFPLMLYLNFKTQGQYGLNGIPINQLKVSKEPLLVLWAYKKRFPWEYLFISIFFVPIIIVFMLLFAYEGNNPFAMLAFIASIIFSIWLLFHSEKYRIPKYLILEEGIVIKNHFVSWTSIDRISWTRDYMASGDNHYKLMIEHLQRLPNRVENQTMMTIKRSIDVNANQYHQVNSIIREHV